MAEITSLYTNPITIPITIEHCRPFSFLDNVAECEGFTDEGIVIYVVVVPQLNWVLIYEAWGSYNNGGGRITHVYRWNGIESFVFKDDYIKRHYKPSHMNWLVGELTKAGLVSKEYVSAVRQNQIAATTQVANPNWVETAVIIKGGAD